MQSDSILRRKTGAGRAMPEIALMTPEKAMRLAFGRAGRAMSGLGLRFAGFSSDRVPLTGLVEAIEPSTLVTALRRDDDQTGLLLVDRGLRSALIEAETTGQVGAVEPPDRAPTRIDAVIVAGFIDAALSLFDEVAAEIDIARDVTGFRVAEVIPGAGAVALTLPEVAYRLMRVEVELGTTARPGAAVIALPHDPPARKAAGPEEALYQAGVQKVVMTVPADLRAVLCRLPVSLDAVSRWEPGMVVPLPHGVLDGVRLEDIDGEPVAKGRLGQINGLRAVRLAAPER